MAHVLVAQDDSIMQSVLRSMLECEGHSVTTVDNGWDALIVMRASLHPLVAVFYDWIFDVRHDKDGPDQEVLWQALARHFTDLQRHRYIEIREREIHRPPEEQAIFDQLGVVTISIPFDLEKLCTMVNEVASQLA